MVKLLVEHGARPAKPSVSHPGEPSGKTAIEWAQGQHHPLYDGDPDARAEVVLWLQSLGCSCE